MSLELRGDGAVCADGSCELPEAVDPVTVDPVLVDPVPVDPEPAPVMGE